MSDFETVLERLLRDPSFQAALAADPTRALAGYTLDADERDLLATQLVTGTGGDRSVETRTNKSGVVGLLGPVVASFGVAAGSQSLGSATGGQTLGSAPGGQALGSAPSTETFGNAPTAPIVGREMFGAADVGGSEAVGAAGAAEAVGDAAGSGTSSVGGAPVQATDYHTHVDVDGDGRWDRHTAYERADGGVDIHVDVNRDGLVDFIGRDFDRDGLVDVADYDKDRDGAMDTRMYDDTGDGWMDRKERIPERGDS